MYDHEFIWKKYLKINEANLISVDPLQAELVSILNSKNVQNQQIKDWFLKTYIKWFKSPDQDNLKTDFISPYEAKESDPEWAKKEGISEFKGFTNQYKDRLNHLIDYLNTKTYTENNNQEKTEEQKKIDQQKKIESEKYLKSLYKTTVPQMLKELEEWDRRMEEASKKAEQEKVKSEKDKDYKVIGIYDNIEVWELISNKAFREESMFMGHCIGQAEGESRVCDLDENKKSQYYKEYLNGNLKIFSFRDPQKKYHPVATFELQKENKNFYIVQMKGKANGKVPEKYHKACELFIRENNLVDKIKKDYKNIGMIGWNGDYYFKNSKEFENVYNEEIIPKQKQTFESIFSKIKIIKGIKTIQSDVFLDFLCLKKLPDLRDVVVTGEFSCYDNQLTTLEGAPQKVGGDFYCSNNQLTTLEGAPQKVGGYFSCSNNQLKTLEGAPQEVGGEFSCSNNQLTTLEGAPQKVGGDFSCYDNQLTTLEGAPQKVGGGFYCYNNQLTTLEGAPQEVGRDFSCYNNQLTTLEGAPQEVGGYFDCSDNQLTTLEGAPQKVGGDFSCSNNPVIILN
jgi:hypothetical protein